MDWYEILVKVPVSSLEQAEAIASMSVPYGFYTEDYSDLEQGAWEIAHIDLIDENLIKKDRENAIIHIYFGKEDNLVEAKALLEELFTASKIPYFLETSFIKEEEWRDNWKKYFKTTNIGEKLLIRPSWEEISTTDRKVLTIDPGVAFGTGTHATTRLCLEMLEKYAENATMLDIGTGSGILAIGASLLGARYVLGVDIDGVAVKVAKENALLNKVENNTDFIVGDLAKDVDGKYNIVCANIVADAIISLSLPARELLAENGVFICSGIIDIRANEVKEALINNGYKIIEEKKKDNWYAYCAVEDKNASI